MGADMPFPRKPDADISLNFVQGSPVLKCELSPSVQTDLIVDTGCDREITVDDGVASRVKINQRGSVSRSDASGVSANETVGVIDSAICGDLTPKAASIIAATSTDSTSLAMARSAGQECQATLRSTVVASLRAVC
jgi:hypothetical protein